MGLFRADKMRLTDIPPKCVPEVANILQHAAGSGRLRAATAREDRVKSLPAELRRSRLEEFFVLARNPLCAAHKALNPSVAELLLRHVQREVGPRLSPLVSQCQLMTADQYARLDRLRSLHALWLPPREYELTFLSCVAGAKWKYQEDQCAACILAHISRDLQALLDIRCTVRSRATQDFVAKHGNPRLQVWLEAWICGLVPDLAAAAGGFVLGATSVLEQNDAEASEWKRLRAKIHHLAQTTLKILDLRQGSSASSVRPAAPGVFHALPGGDDDGDDEGPDPALQDYDAFHGAVPTPAGHQVPVFDSGVNGQNATRRLRASTASPSVYTLDTVKNNDRVIMASSVNVQASPSREAHRDTYVPPRQLWKPQGPLRRSSRQTSRRRFDVESNTTDAEWDSRISAWDSEDGEQPAHALDDRLAHTYTNLLEPHPFDSTLDQSAKPRRFYGEIVIDMSPKVMTFSPQATSLSPNRSDNTASASDYTSWSRFYSK